ncbi:HAD family hydrolase [Gordonia aichiensis]
MKPIRQPFGTTRKRRRESSRPADAPDCVVAVSTSQCEVGTAVSRKCGVLQHEYEVKFNSMSSEVGVRKPSRRIYALACERLGVDPAAAVMVDDLQQNLDGAARLSITRLDYFHSSDRRRCHSPR